VRTENGIAVASIVPLPALKAENPFLMRKLMPGFAELRARRSGSTDRNQIISQMHDGR
jgi:hypothetical protein